MMEAAMIAIHRCTGRTVAPSSRESISAIANMAMMMAVITTIPTVQHAKM
jgi:hypothetical protein